MASGRHTSSAEFIHISGHPSVACVGRWRRHGMFFLPSPSPISIDSVALREASVQADLAFRKRSTSIHTLGKAL